MDMDRFGASAEVTVKRYQTENVEDPTHYSHTDINNISKFWNFHSSTRKLEEKK